MVKVSAVVSTNGGRSGASCASLSRISTAVTMLVLTPHMMWTFTQPCLRRVTPYLWSYQGSNRQVVKPEESPAKSTSTDASGLLDSTIRDLRSGVNSGSSRNRDTRL